MQRIFPLLVVIALSACHDSTPAAPPTRTAPKAAPSSSSPAELPSASVSAAPQRVAAPAPEEDADDRPSDAWARTCKRFLEEAIAAVTKDDPSAVGRAQAIIHKSGDGTVIVMASIRGERPLEELEAAAALWDQDVEQTPGWKGGIRNSGRVGGTLTLMRDAPRARRDRFERETRRAIDRCMEAQPQR